MLRENLVWCQQALKVASVGPNVGADDGEIQRLDERDQWVDSSVKLMITEGHNVKSDLVDCIGYDGWT